MKIRFNGKELQKLSVRNRRKAERWRRTHGFCWQLNQKLNAARKERFGLPAAGADRSKTAERLMRNARKLERQEVRQ